MTQEQDQQARFDASRVTEAAHWIKTRYSYELDHVHSDTDRRAVDARMRCHMLALIEIAVNNIPRG